MTLLERLTKLNANRAVLRERIARKAARRESTSADAAKLVRETLKQIRAEIRLEKKGAA